MPQQRHELEALGRAMEEYAERLRRDMEAALPTPTEQHDRLERLIERSAFQSFYPPSQYRDMMRN